MNLLMTLVLAICGGIVLQFLHVPLPWTLGPIVALSLASLVLRRRFYWSLKVRNIALILLGYAMGRPFTLAAGQAILSQLPLMLAATMVTVGAGIFTGWLMYKKTGINFTSCLLGCVPGGLSQMVILADEIKDADLTAVTIMQTMRMLSVVFVVPFLTMHVLPAAAPMGQNAVVPATVPGEMILLFAGVAIFGAVLGRMLHLPTATLLGPILSTGAFLVYTGMTAPVVPAFYINLAQICVGSYIGTSVNLRKLGDYHGMGPCLFAGIAVVLLTSMLMGAGVSFFTGASFATGFLSTAPGGLTEMGITALIVGADISTMTAYQLVRLLFIMLVFPYIAKGIVYLYRKNTATPFR